MNDGDEPVWTSAVASSGPWTFHLNVSVTASCTGCGIIPLDERTGLMPHFDSTEQAREELLRDHGWHYVTWPAQDTEAAALLCPECADGRSAAQAWPDRLDGHQSQELPANAAVAPAGRAGGSGRGLPWRG